MEEGPAGSFSRSGNIIKMPAKNKVKEFCQVKKMMQILTVTTIPIVITLK
jgi:hypothetical protein